MTSDVQARTHRTPRRAVGDGISQQVSQLTGSLSGGHGDRLAKRQRGYPIRLTWTLNFQQHHRRWSVAIIEDRGGDQGDSQRRDG
jgi:hypothetical protein